MNPSQMARIAPTAVLLAYLIYSGYSLESSMPLATDQKAGIARGLDVLMNEVAEVGEELLRLEGDLRDPFQIVVPPPPEPEPNEVVAAVPPPDPLEAIVSALNLEATFVQGKEQIAIIDGRIYSKGQRLKIDEARAPDARLVLLFVKPTGVILRGDGRNYALAYPDHFPTREPVRPVADADPPIDLGGQMEMFQKLLGSPLGALGKGLIGNLGSSPSRSRPSRENAR